MIKEIKPIESVPPEVRELENKTYLLLQDRARYEMALRALSNFRVYEDEDAKDVVNRVRRVASKALDGTGTP